MTNKKGRNSLSQTPKSAKKDDGVIATALGNKRPREEEEDDSSFDEELAASLLKGKNVKKLKQMISDDGDHSDEEEDDEEEGSGEEEDDSEDDSEDDDEDDEDQDSDTDQEFPEKVVENAKQPKSTPKQVEKPVKVSPVKAFEAPAPFKPSSSNVVLFNLPRLKEDELRGFLTKRGVQPESVCCITAPAALVGLPNEAAAKKAISACSGSAYGLKTLAAVSVSGDVSKIQTHKNPNPSSPDGPLTCVLATFIPKSVTSQDILKMIGIKPKNLHLITRGAKNKVSNACYIDCNNEEDAKKVYAVLQGKEIENSRLKVHLKPQQNFNPITEKSFVVANVPFTSDIEDVKKEFPTASQVELTHKGSFLLHFPTAEARKKAAENAMGKTMGGRVLRIVTSERSGAEYTVFIANLPFEVKTEEVRACFPKSNRINLQMGKNGKCNGTAIVFFPTQEAANAAKKEVSSKQIQGRTLRVRGDSDAAAPEAHKPAKKEAEKPSLKKAELPAQVGSESEDDEDDEDEASDDAEDEVEGSDEAEDEVEGSDDVEDEEEGSDEEGSDEEGSDEDDAEDDGDNQDDDEPPTKKSKPQQPAHVGGDDKPRGGFKPFNGRGGGKFQSRGGHGGGGFQHRGGRGGGGFTPRGGRGSGGFRGGRGGGGFRGGRGRGGTPNRGGRGFRRD